MADGTIAAHSRARIDALFVHARAVTRAVAVDHALRIAATAEWASLELGQALAHRISIEHAANGVLAARRRIAGIGRWRRNFLSKALLERIALHAVRARTDRCVVDNGTFCLPSTYTGTRVFAAVVDAGQRLLTVSIADTLRAARFVRITEIVFDALAQCRTVVGWTTPGIGTAR